MIFNLVLPLLLYCSAHPMTSSLTIYSHGQPWISKRESLRKWGSTKRRTPTHAVFRTQQHNLPRNGEASRGLITAAMIRGPSKTWARKKAPRTSVCWNRHFGMSIKAVSRRGGATLPECLVCPTNCRPSSSE